MEIESESVALCPHIERDAHIEDLKQKNSKLELALFKSRQNEISRATFKDCVLRLSELGCSHPQLTKAMRAAFLMRKEPGLTFEQCYAYVNHVDKYDRPEKGQPISD